MLGFCPPETSETPTSTGPDPVVPNRGGQFSAVSICLFGGRSVQFLWWWWWWCYLLWVFCFVLGFSGETKKRVDNESTQRPKDSFGRRDRKKCIQNKGNSEGKSV